ncbi:unnamed protein product [Peniophora sp. CBMAI 1063]|nr:unnamed protein product [Peniophora sp. CBMAI 1063]
MATERVQGQYFSRKVNMAIKRHDSETLTREDVQYDLLNAIFLDNHRVFTDESATPDNPKPLVAFCDLYVNALYNSTKCSKIMRDKMHETPAFAIEFAKISLLTNVGRINTTMAFFPEMKTALRSYHPVPSLQKTDGNVQDAPRIKNCLKAALLPAEGAKGATVPSSPTDILKRLREGLRPPTSIVNLIFVLTNFSHAISGEFFEQGIEFVDLFLPSDISSQSRARAFLWLIYRFHEGTDKPNPFDDHRAGRHPGRAPLLERLNHEDLRKENVDEPAEIEWGRKMALQRSAFLQDLVSGGGEGSRDSTKHAHTTAKAQPVPVQVSHPNGSVHLQQTPSGGPPRGIPTSHRKQPTFHHYIPANARPPKPVHEGPPRVSAVLTAQRREPEYRTAHRRSRTMFQQAWHRVQTRDALYDSDNEENLDEDARWDYHQRSLILRAISSRITYR